MGYDIRDRNNIGEISVNHPNHLVVTIDLSSATWNTVATHEVFTVTGLVDMRIWILCTADLTSSGAATLDLGYEGAVTAWGQDIAYTGVDANEAFNVATTLFESPNGNTINWGSVVGISVVFWGKDVGYEVKVAALTGGTLEFHCVWEPLTAGAAVVAGAGGSL